MSQHLGPGPCPRGCAHPALASLLPAELGQLQGTLSPVGCDTTGQGGQSLLRGCSPRTQAGWQERRCQSSQLGRLSPHQDHLCNFCCAANGPGQYSNPELFSREAAGVTQQPTLPTTSFAGFFAPGLTSDHLSALLLIFTACKPQV